MGNLENMVRHVSLLLGLDDWNEHDHPRDEDGKFTSGGGSSDEKESEIESLKKMISGLSRFGEQGKKRSELVKRLEMLSPKQEKAPKRNAETQNHEKIEAKEFQSFPVDDHKNEQFEIIQRTNPMHDDYHTGIRKPENIRSPKEAFEPEDDAGYLYPDFTKEDGKKALESGKITLYSSYPIEDGTFVTPSKMMASDYSGGGKVYSKEVSINDVAWINADEGQFASVKNNKRKQNSVKDGGPGSGNFNHGGRPGEIGGSSGEGGGSGKTRTSDKSETIALVSGSSNYTSTPEYKEAQSKHSEAFEKREKLKKEWLDLQEQLKSEIVETPELKELGRQYADLFDAYTDKGKEIKEKAKAVREEMKVAEADEKKYRAELEKMTAENREKEKAEFNPEPLTEAKQDEYEGFTTESDTPYIKEKLENGEAWIAEMDPKEYLERCAFQIFNQSTLESTVGAVDPENANKYADEMESGTKFSVPYLNFSDKEQEGRHRAVAAMMNGYKKIPVVIVGKKPGVENDFDNVLNDAKPQDAKGHFVGEELKGAPCPHSPRVKEIIKALSGKNPKINKERQDQHINAKAARDATEKEKQSKPNKSILPKSYFTISMQAAHAIVRDKIKKGLFRVGKNNYGVEHLLIDVDKPVGYRYNIRGEKFPSKTIRVDYSSKDGYHIFPTDGGENK